MTSTTPEDTELLNDVQRRMRNTTEVLIALDQMLGSAVVARGRYTTVLKVNTADWNRFLYLTSHASLPEATS